MRRVFDAARSVGVGLGGGDCELCSNLVQPGVRASDGGGDIYDSDFVF